MQNRAQLETSLGTARALVKAYFEAEDCHWEKRFHIEQEECRECTERYVCEWLFQQDPAPDLSICSAEQLRKALTFAIGYPEGHMLRADHETDHCPCAICAWVRETYSLLLVEKLVAPVPIFTDVAGGYRRPDRENGRSFCNRVTYPVITVDFCERQTPTKR